MNKELSTDRITHKLKIKGEDPIYLTTKEADFYFKQMSDPKNATITLVNAEKLIYITKYKSEIDLMILDDFSSNYEDIMYVAGLDKIQKQYIRDFLELRKKKREKITSGIVKIIVDKIKQGEKLPF